MGLDIYAGTLTRYYSRDWKNIVQQTAEINGQKCVMTDGLGNEVKPVDDETELTQIRDIISQWTGNLATAIDNGDTSGQLWNETDARDYFTDKPDWLAYGALIMLQAYDLLQLSLPEYIDSRHDAFDDPVVKKCMSRETGLSLLSNVGFWLPIDRKFIIETNLPTGDEAPVSTLRQLKQELYDLNQRIWKADEATIMSWRHDKYYCEVTQTEVKRILGFIPRKKQTVKFRTEDLAQSAFAILYKAVTFALEQKVPLLLDF